MLLPLVTEDEQRALEARLTKAIDALTARVDALEQPEPEPAPEPEPVDCVLGPEIVVSETSLEACQPDGTQRVEVAWAREVLTAPAHGGAPCGPTSGTRVESRPCVYVPPVPVGEGPHDYFDRLVASPYHYASYSLRDQAQITSLVSRTRAVPNTTYAPDADTFVDKQDAAKIVIPADGTNYEQLRMPINIGAEYLGVEQVKALVMWDFYWDKSWRDKFPQGIGGKSFQLARPSGRVWLETRNQGFSGLPPEGASAFDVRAYVGGASATEAGSFRGATPGFGYTTSDSLGPMQNTFVAMCNTWTRFYEELTFTAGDPYVTFTVWMCDENQDPVCLLRDIRVVGNAGLPGCRLHQFWVEYNYSQLQLGAAITAYARNVLVLRDVPDPTALFARPRR